MEIDQERMDAWCERAKTDPEVRVWLKRNPPPADWSGTPEEWAYTEMPSGSAYNFLRWLLG